MTWWCSATGQTWTWAWRPYPGVWLFVACLAAGYWALAWRGTGRAPGFGVAGLLLVWVLLDWPIGALGAGYLVSVHAVQFLLLAFVVPPLLYAGVSAGRWGWLEERIGRGRALRVITHPVVAGAGFNAIVVTTHLPSVVDGLMARQFGAFAVDFAWLLGGLLFWWPVLAPFPARAGGALAKIGYLFVGSLVHTALGMWLLLSRFPVYGIFELAPPLGGRSAVVDQGIAGGLMELIGGLIIITSIAVVFFQWVRREEAERLVHR